MKVGFLVQALCHFQKRRCPQVVANGRFNHNQFAVSCRLRPELTAFGGQFIPTGYLSFIDTGVTNGSLVG
jgi:hypothetical protein